MFKESYQRAIVKQYDYFRSIEGNKIVFIGGSSLSFGYDMDTMEELSGKPCPILGNHASDGFPFLFEMSKSNLSEGDTVVIEYYGSSLDASDGDELLLTGVGKRYDMHKFFPACLWKSLIKAVPLYVQKNMKYFRLGEQYCSDIPYINDAFDERGNMSLERLDTWLSEDYVDNDGSNEELQYRDYYSSVNNINYAVFDYINEYISYCESIGVKVLITLPPVYSDAVPSYCGEDIMDKFDSIIRENINAPLITASKDNTYGREYVYDFMLHLNSEGAKLRTERLYEDISNNSGI